MNDLIAKIEAATEGSDELDLLIWKALHPEAVSVAGVWRHSSARFVSYHTELSQERWAKTFPKSGQNESDFRRNQELPPYTTRPYDLTAAVTLMDDGWECGFFIENGKARAFVDLEPSDSPGWKSHESVCATPALAMCAAALKAKMG